jgi:hypothetical protein
MIARASHPEAGSEATGRHSERATRASRVILSERKDRFRATAVKALDGQRSFRRCATQDDPRGCATQDDTGAARLRMTPALARLRMTTELRDSG